MKIIPIVVAALIFSNLGVAGSVALMCDVAAAKQGFNILSPDWRELAGLWPFATIVATVFSTWAGIELAKLEDRA